MSRKSSTEPPRPTPHAANHTGLRRGHFGSTGLAGARGRVVTGFCCLGLWCGVWPSNAAQGADSDASPPLQILTNVSQFPLLFSEDADSRHPFQLAGTVTLVDTNRDLFVLQDGTGAMAINLDLRRLSLEPGQLVMVEGTGEAPYLASFPDYPYRPSGWDIKNSFEGPTDWGEYNLTRMRGYLHPPITGEYTFWIASDNSSELWLSTDEDPAKIKRIAFIKEGDWVDPHEWTRYPSQRSEPIFLRAGQTYYIEAVQEQLLLNENLAVAWEGPRFERSVVDGRYLTPWIENQDQAPYAGTNGILREYWTNYTVGSVLGITGRRPFNAMVTLKQARVTVLGRGNWPEPRHISLDQPLPVENNFRWGRVQGMVSFIGVDGDGATLELTDSQGQTQVRVAGWKGRSTQLFQNHLVQIEGVCEGMQTTSGYLKPGLIWAPGGEEISFIETTNANYPSTTIPSPDQLAAASGGTNQAWKDFFSIRGVVTLNDQVLGKDCLYIQDDANGIYISQAVHHLNQLQIGQWVNIGGNLLSGKYGASLNPINITMLGRRPMPQPATQPVEIPVVTSRNGQWTELEGVIRSLNPNGTMTMMGKAGPVSIWIGKSSKDVLGHYVDSTLRLRGVLSVADQENPVLMVPSRSFVQVEEEAPEDPFAILSDDMAELDSDTLNTGWIHRAKTRGVVSYVDGPTLFIQDALGGAQIETGAGSAPHMGDEVEVVGFPENAGFSLVLTNALVRQVSAGDPLKPRNLDVSRPALADYRGTLVSLKATFLAQKTGGVDQVLDLQAGQHIFEAVLPPGRGELPSPAAGSLLEITGIFQAERASLAGKTNRDKNIVAESIRILLRNPEDVVVLTGPPWWSWKGITALVSIVLVVVTMALLAIYLLRQRLERQEAAQFFFSRQILQGQEDERRRIAANLHDTLGQNLLVIKNQSRLALQLPTDESVLRHRLDEISQVASVAIEEVRQITHNLRPYQLDRLGLTQTIRTTIKQVSENYPIIFASHVDEIDGIFDKESEIHVYRIIQESINNIVKHSDATEATAVVKRQTAAVSISIRDNGRGFDPGQVNSAGFGLSGIKERVWILGGKSAIDASAGQGVNLTFEIPMSRT